jgi:ABC-type lipoprotein release transport system permease subunit
MDYSIDPHLILAECAVFMFVVRLIACLGPTLRGLRIRPVEALKES